ncbi:MAG: hypothetical protein N4A59_14210, partial [Marinifilum sp.]|nr:hypothetical protein [Marinifilum sp.]
MKELLTISPLFGAFIGVILVVFVGINKSIHKDNPKARFLLGLFILMTAINLFEDFIYITSGVYYLWFSYLYYPLIGFVYLLYIRYLLKLEFQLKYWIGAAIVLSVLHGVLLYKYDIQIDDLSNVPEPMDTSDIMFAIDNYISLFFNVAPVFYIYRKVRRMSLNSIESKGHLNLMWAKRIIGSAVFIVSGLLVYTIVITVIITWVNPYLYFEGSLNGKALVYTSLEELRKFQQFEALLMSMFVYSIAIWSIRIPVFSSY